MANQEQLDILKQGVETWNQWRREHTDIKPDLVHAYLGEADLRGALQLHFFGESLAEPPFGKNCAV